VIARALKEREILTIAVVTKPFDFEGKKRALIADQAIKQLKQDVDTLIVMPNQNLLNVVDAHTSMIDAFNLINAVLGQSVKSISEIITRPGHINVDFADVRTIMKDRGLAIMGTARASGQDRALEATLAAISSPLLESMNMKGSRSVLLNITGSKNLSLHEISQAASVIYDQADPDAQIILGSVIDDSLGDDVQVTIIATGFEDAQRAQLAAQEIKVTGATCDLQCAVDEPVLEAKPAAKPEPVVEKQPIATVLSTFKKNHEMPAMTELLVEGDELDAPTFMRAKHHEKELE
jgi:cell division protein FtsZ